MSESEYEQKASLTKESLKDYVRSLSKCLRRPCNY